MRTFQKAVVLTFAVLVLLFNSSAKAQMPTYKPGQTIRISVTFAGVDAGKIGRVGMNLTIPQTPPSQPGFATQTAWGQSKQIGPNTFEVSYKIPETQASGDYSLGQINATVDPDSPYPITISYTSPADFSDKKFRIDNPQSIVKPTIKDVKELP